MLIERHWVRHRRYRKPLKPRSPALEHNPQKKGVVVRSFETTPRKPNSARRKTAKVRLCNSRRIHVYFEGLGFNKLQPHSVVLIRGLGPRDLPGVRYHAIRGQFDLVALPFYRRARSKYGVKKPDEDKFVWPPIEATPGKNLKFLRRERYRYLIYKHLFASRKYKFFLRRFWLLKAFN